MPAKKNIVGVRFGMLVVLGEADRPRLVSCRCDCGNTSTPVKTDLMQGRVLSCGCYRAARLKAGMRLTHGHSVGRSDKTHAAWLGMRRRCTDKKDPHYPDYGGRGISVCDRWQVFENFLSDMGQRPEGKTLDRFPDNNGNYEPGNCRWATPKEQANNRRLRVDSIALIAVHAETGVEERFESIAAARKAGHIDSGIRKSLACGIKHHGYWWAKQMRECLGLPVREV